MLQSPWKFIAIIILSICVQYCLVYSIMNTAPPAVAAQVWTTVPEMKTGSD